jgi:FeS assembly SUF system protein
MNELKNAQLVADEQMIKNAVGEENYDELSEPSSIENPPDHPKWPLIKAAIKEIYDPEIPVNIYELGLIYDVKIIDVDKDIIDIEVKMTLTSPGCPVAQEMPGWVQGAVFTVEGVRDVDVEIIWDPTWTPAMMSEAAKMQLNMFT